MLWGDDVGTSYVRLLEDKKLNIIIIIIIDRKSVV